MVQDGEDDLVHVLPQPEVDFLLLLEGFHELMGMGEMVRSWPGPGFGQSPEAGVHGECQCPRKELRRPWARWPQDQLQHSDPRTCLSLRPS